MVEGRGLVMLGELRGCELSNFRCISDSFGENHRAGPKSGIIRSRGVSINALGLRKNLDPTARSWGCSALSSSLVRYS